MATITTLQGSTQIGNSDEIINANFQNINNAIVEKTGNQTIAGDKTFTAVDFIHDVTNNTDNPNMRRLSDKRRTKNYNNAGGVEFALYVDSDNSIVGFRKRALRGYLKKWLTGANANTSELFAIEFDTYDGDATYTSRTSIKTDSFYFNDQNITGAWTNRTPARDGGITFSGYTVNSASYKQIGKTVFVQTYLAFTATSTGITLNITLPKTVVSGKYFAGVTWMGGGATFNHMGYCDGSDDTFHFETSFTSGTPYSIMFSATYETE